MSARSTDEGKNNFRKTKVCKWDARVEAIRKFLAANLSNDLEKERRAVMT